MKRDGTRQDMQRILELSIIQFVEANNRGRLCCFNIIINVSPALLLYLTKKLLSPQTKEAALLLDIVDFLFSFLSFSVFCCSLILSHGYI